MRRPARTVTVLAAVTLGAAPVLAGATAAAQSAAGTPSGTCSTTAGPLGSASGTSLTVTVGPSPSARGVARAELAGGGQSSHVSGTVRWTNTTTGTSGQKAFGPMGGDLPRSRLDLTTGPGRVDWKVEGTVEQTILSLAIPALSLGLTLPTTSAEIQNCSGTTEID